jgi:hypothetical protein
MPDGKHLRAGFIAPSVFIHAECEYFSRLSDHPNLRVDGDMHAPDHSKPASQRHGEEVDHKIDQGEIADPGRKRSV